MFRPFWRAQARGGPKIDRATLRDADALIVRSVTPVDRALLAGTPVRFVGSATAGVDHIALQDLREQGIVFANAPGSNANSVVDYVLAALACLFPTMDQLHGKTVGIVGCGEVGSRLLRRLQGLPLTCRVYDPFLAPGSVPGLGPLEAVLDADIISLHTPLTKTGPYPSYQLLNAVRLAELHPGTVLINTARGGVVDNAALAAGLQTNQDLRVVLDVFENEPTIDGRLLDRVHLLTPHIAGYAVEAKIRSTEMIYRALCEFLQCENGWPVGERGSPVDVAALLAQDKNDLPLALIRHCYDLGEESRDCRTALTAKGSNQATVFDRLRREYPARGEMGLRPLLLPDDLAEPSRQSLLRLGFAIGEEPPGMLDSR